MHLLLLKNLVAAKDSISDSASNNLNAIGGRMAAIAGIVGARVSGRSLDKGSVDINDLSVHDTANTADEGWVDVVNDSLVHFEGVRLIERRGNHKEDLRDGLELSQLQNHIHIVQGVVIT